MKRLVTLFSVLGLLASAPLSAALKTGTAAPAFDLVDSHGKKHTLDESKGKWVVLEWLNHGCPYVKKQYGSGNMQSLQKKYTGKGVVWYSVISSAAGKQGSGTSEEVNKDVKKEKATPSAVLLDSEGKMGKSYGAMTTPHMFVIDPKGVLVYQGAIDDKPTTELSDVKGARNYVGEALDLAMAGKPVKEANTKSYGCSVKYKD